MKRVILYHHSGCGHCRAAQEFLQRRGIAFEKRDIRADSRAYNELVNRWKSRSAVTLIIDNEVIIGLPRTRERLEKLRS
jgi:glutaredoxin